MAANRRHQSKSTRREGRAFWLFATAVLIVAAPQVADTGPALGETTVGSDADLEWVGGYHEPFNFEQHFDYMMNNCGTNGAALPFNGLPRDTYINRATYHAALDMNADSDGTDAGDTVYSIADGTYFAETMGANSFGGMGRGLWITHEADDGTIFNAGYGHIEITLPADRNLNEPGRQINRGDAIGTIASGPAPHLHLTIDSDATRAQGGTFGCDGNWPSQFGFEDPVAFLIAHPIDGSPAPDAVPSKPAPPTCVSNDDGSILVSWTRPAENGSPIHNYSLKRWQVGDAEPGEWWGRATRTSTLYPSPPIGSSNIFQIRATNGAGDSLNSEWSTPCTSNKAPSKPAPPTCVSNDDGSILVSWTRPAENGSPIHNYSLKRWQVGDAEPGEWWGRATRTSTLYPSPPIGSSNIFQIRATNGAGNSLNSEWSTPCTSSITDLCNGLAVTVDIGAGDMPTSGDDVILGTAGDDTIVAGDGDDTVCAGDGDDVVFGGGGNDTISGEGDDDLMSGNAGNDVIEGGDGNDTVFAGSGNDTVNGGTGDDTIGGSSGLDTISGGDGDDHIFAGSDADGLISGGNGDDAVNGGGGNDNNVHGDAGNDTVSGNGGSDTVYGDDGDDQVRGGQADDTVFGGAGDDFVAGNNGTDTCDGGTGTDTAASNCEAITGVP